MKRVVTAALLCFSGCATVPKGDVELLKPAIELFHSRARWKDFRGAAELVVDEKRGEFVKARAKLNDDRDLFITNFEIEDARVALDLLSADAVTKISWYRLPSTTEVTSLVTNHFVWRNETWQLEAQDEGPFDELKPPALKAKSLEKSPEKKP
jgi:hypothetical protein